MMLSLSTTLDDLIRQQENLRIQSVRHLEELRSRQDRYRRCRPSEHRAPDQSNVSRGVGGLTDVLNEGIVHIDSVRKTVGDCTERRYRPVSTVSKSSSLQGLSTLSTNASDGQFSQKSADLNYINVRNSTSAVFSDDVNSEKWSSSAARNARMKLTSGRMQTNLNNSSSVNIDSGLRDLVPALGSSVDSNGCRSSEIDASNTAGYFSSSSDADIGKLNGTLTPQKSEQSLDETPKSILRHRQIVDKNVCVESKFDHTPTNVRRNRHRCGLNFSYSDVNDAELFGCKTKSVNFDIEERSTRESVAVNSNTNSNLDNMSQLRSLKSSSSAVNNSPASQRFYRVPDAADSVTEMSVNGRKSGTVNKLVSDGLLLQTGNDRRNAKIVRELESRSRSDLFSTDEPSVMNMSTNASQSQLFDRESLSKSYVDSAVQPFTRLISDGQSQSQPLLGYDWIAGIIDSDSSSLDGMPDAYFDDVREFRQRNRDACVGSVDFIKSYEHLGRPVSPELPNKPHTCIHGYTVNERLFTEPTTTDESGNSICPSCTQPRKQPTTHSPGFVRVSIPKQVFSDSYQPKPHRRHSFDATDSCALSQHCLIGWQCSHLSHVPTAPALDLRHATQRHTATQLPVSLITTTASTHLPTTMLTTAATPRRELRNFPETY